MSLDGGDLEAVYAPDVGSCPQKQEVRQTGQRMKRFVDHVAINTSELGRVSAS